MTFATWIELSVGFFTIYNFEFSDSRLGQVLHVCNFVLVLGSEQTPSQSSGGQRLVTADGTYATQSALSTPGITSLVKKDDEKR